VKPQQVYKLKGVWPSACSVVPRFCSLPFSSFLLRSRSNFRERNGILKQRRESMSGGIARGRLAEERKSWRKNHPHVRFSLFALSSLCLFAFIHSSDLFISSFVVNFVFIDGICLWFLLFFFFLCDFVCFWLGFCCEARNTTWWLRQFDGLALHYPWKARGEFFNFLLHFF